MQVKNQYKILDFERIQGLDSLWEIVIKCADQKVKDDSLFLL